MAFFKNKKQNINEILDENGFYSVNKEISKVLSLLNGYLNSNGAPIKIEPYIQTEKEILPHTPETIKNILNVLKIDNENSQIKNFSYFETNHYIVVFSNWSKEYWVFHKYKYNLFTHGDYEDLALPIPKEYIVKGIPEIPITAVPIDKEKENISYIVINSYNSGIYNFITYNVFTELNNPIEIEVDKDTVFSYDKQIHLWMFDIYSTAAQFSTIQKIVIPNSEHIKFLYSTKKLTMKNSTKTPISVSTAIPVFKQEIYPSILCMYYLNTPYETLKIYFDPYNPNFIVSTERVPLFKG